MQRVWATIETGLRRYPWVITLATLVPCAYFTAVGTNHLLASSVLKADVAMLARQATAAPTTPAGQQAAEGPTSFHARDVHRILARNVFDAQAGCLNCAPAPEEQPTEEGGEGQVDASNRPPEPCEGNARVTGAVEVEDPLWSFAFVATSPSDPAMPYRMGMMVDGKTVTGVGWHQEYGAFVMLRQGASGQHCLYAQIMPPRNAPPPPPPVASAPPPSGGPSDSLAAILDQGIERAGPNEFSLRRSVVDRILEHQAELMRTTRIVPHEEGGRTVGVQMFGVRGNSLLGRLGMQNGDVLNRINGLEIASPDRALEAYARLRTSDRITISLTRNGQPVNIDFNIR